MRADGICDAHRNTEIDTVGSLDMGGYFDGWFAKGFSFIKCLCELIANGIDPTVVSSEFEFMSKGQDIFMSDNGCGMDKTNIKNMFALHHSNHSNDYSMGRSGIGGKIASAILSEKGEVVMFTRKKGGSYLKIVVPWWKIFEEKNIKHVKILAMDEDEIHIHFTSKHRESGTTYKFKHSNALETTIEDAFTTPADGSKEMNDMPCIVFGKSPVNITFKSERAQSDLSMQKYDYFGGASDDYYVRNKYTIAVYEDVKNNKKFVLTMPDGTMYEPKFSKGIVCKTGKGIKIAIIGDDFKLQVTFDVVAGMRKNQDLIDNINKHKDSVKSNKKDKTHKIDKVKVPIAPYDRDFFGTDQNHERDAKPLLYRNGQFIGNLPYAGNISSIRGGWDSQVKGSSVRIELSYKVESTQTNYSDIIVGIQENKNQYNGRDIPAEIQRLLMLIREDTYGCVEQEITNLTPSSKEANESESSDTESEPSSEEVAAHVPAPEPEPEPAPVPAPVPAHVSEPTPSQSSRFASVDVIPTFVTPHFRELPSNTQIDEIVQYVYNHRPESLDDKADVLKALNILYAYMNK